MSGDVKTEVDLMLIIAVVKICKSQMFKQINID